MPKVPIATKLGKFVTYLDQLLPIKSHNSLKRFAL